MKSISKETMKRFMSILLSIVMAFSLVIPAFAQDGETEAVNYGTVTAFTDGFTVSGTENPVVYNEEEITLDFSKADFSVGRVNDGWWAGIKIIAPEGLTEEELRNATYKRYGKDGWSEPISFWNAKDSAEGAEVHYMGAWMLVTPELIETDDDGKLTLKYQFEWKADLVQEFTFEIDTTKVNLIHSEGCTIVVEEEGYAPDCTTEGKNEKSYCEVCGLVYGDGSVIDALGHDFSEMIINDAHLQQKLDAQSSYYYNCSRENCDEISTELTYTVNDEEVNIHFADVSGITEGLVVSGTDTAEVAVTNNEEITLDFAKADETIGRYMDAWWAGVKVLVPSELSEDELRNAKLICCKKNIWGEELSFWQYKDSQEGDRRHYVTLWVPVTPADIAEGGFITNEYVFDWDGNGFGISTQKVIVEIDTTKVNLIHSEGCTIVVEEEGYAPDCTTEGKNEKSYCEVCGLVYGDGSVIDALGHDFSEMIIDEEHRASVKTCASYATYKYDCSRCDEMSETTFENADEGKEPHVDVQKTEEAYLAAPAGCETAAEYYWSCENCGRVSEEIFIYGEPAGHLYSVEKVTKKATLGEDGYTNFYCQDCGACDEEPISFAGIENVSISRNSYVYTGEAFAPSVTVEDSDGNALVEGTDYKVSYLNNIEPGIATAEVTFEGRYTGTKILQFNITLPATAEISFVATTTAVSLSWAAVEKATGYKVCRKTSAGWEDVGTTNSTEMTVEGLSAGKRYTFLVKAYINVDGIDCWSDQTKEICIATKSKAPSKVSSTQTVTTVTFEWSKVTGAEKYQIYKYDPSTESREYYKTTTTTSVTVKNLVSATRYSYVIVPVVSTEDGVDVAGEQKIVSVTTKPKVTSKLTASSTVKTVTLNWSKVDRADGYRVYRYNTATKSYDYYKTVTANSVTITGLGSATSYKYLVKAFVNDADGKQIIGDSKSISATTKPVATSKLTATATASTVTLKWSKVDRADGYRVYKYNSASKSYDYYKTVTANSITLTGLSGATSYKYLVKAIVKAADGSEIAGASKKISVTTMLAATKKLTSTVTVNSATLKWSKVDRADGYRIYKYNSKTKAYDYYKTVKGTSITIKNLTSATDYKYSVKAYRTGSGGKVEIGEAKNISVTTKPLAVKNMSATATEKTATLKWSKVDRADGYKIYKYNTKTKAYDYCKTVTGTTTTVKSLSGVTVYKFLVKAFVKSADGKEVIGNGKSVSIMTCPSSVKNISATAGTSKATLKWDKVANADGYRIYKYNSRTKSYDYLTITFDTSYSITGLTSATSYKYAIKAVVIVIEEDTLDVKEITGDGKSVSFTTKPSNPSSVTVLAKSGKATVKWKSVSRASGYQVFCKNTKTGKLELIGSTKSNVTSFAKSGYKKGTKYTFAVRAYKTVDSKKIYSDYVYKTVTMK